MRGNDHVPPASGTSAIFAKASCKYAERAATRMSQASAMLAEAPTAGPLSAAIVTLGNA